MLRTMFLALSVALAGLLAVPSGHAAEPVVVTVTGNIAAPNRGAVDPFEDPVFAHLDVKFDKGFTFTLGELKALPQRSVTVRYKAWPREVTASGPGLADVLKAAGASGKKILVQAVDGYAPEFTDEDVARDKLILALEADGKPLPLGGQGPLWLLGPPDSFAGQEDDGGLAYAVIRIDVQ
jgi:hypothetical protein